MPPKWSRFLFCLIVLVAIASVEEAFATQILFRSPEQLGAQSALVVRGSVTGTRPFWNETHTKIFTDVSVSIDETYKGSGSSVVQLRQLGGEIDGVRMTVQGALRWRAGEEVLLFLEPYVSGTYHVSGFSQGKYDIERDVETGRAYVMQAVQTVSDVVGAPAVQSASESERVPLEQFLDRALARKGGAR